MKIWVDDVRPAPEGYIHCTSVWMTIALIITQEHWPNAEPIEVIDLDHDAGEFHHQGGDYIKILDWMEKNYRNYPIHIHSMNPVGVANMRRIIQKNGWKEI